MRDKEPYDRRDFAGALAANAAAKPFNIAILIATMAAGTAVGGSLAVTLVAAVAVYLIAVVRTFFDEEEADRVLARERGERSRRLQDGETARVDLGALAEPIREHVRAARRREQLIREAIDRSELPYEEVSAEVDGFVRAMERTATRAQGLCEALGDAPPERVAARLEQVRRERDPSKKELADALAHQLRVQERMSDQLERFYDEMERMVVELDTVRGSLLTLSASEDTASQRELAGDVRSLRERMGAVADGMAEAYEGR